MAKRRIVWTPQAKADFEGIRAFIARRAPKTAKAYTRRLTSAVQRLRKFPELGAVLEDHPESNAREIIFGSFRIIYKILGKDIFIITVIRGSRLLDPQDLQ